VESDPAERQDPTLGDPKAQIGQVLSAREREQYRSKENNFVEKEGAEGGCVAGGEKDRKKNGVETIMLEGGTRPGGNAAKRTGGCGSVCPTWSGKANSGKGNIIHTRSETEER